MNSRLSLLVGVAAVSSLGACASVPPPAPGAAVASAADNHRIEVSQTGERLDIAVAAGDTSLAPQARAELATLASGYLRYGHGALILSTPSGSANSDSAGLIAQQARMQLSELGVSYGAIAGSTYDATGNDSAPVVVTFTRYEARAPDCRPIYEQDLAHQSNNQPWESFGCATQANLAAMIEDPRDLLGPRAEDPRDSGRRSDVFDAYRNGDVTHATRSPDERVTISNAVQ